MFLVYVDETGDDGYPAYSSPLFALTTFYSDCDEWQSTFDAFKKFRYSLKQQYNLPIKMEMHTKQFVLNKKPYLDLRLTEDQRMEIMEKYCNFIASMNGKFINVVIDKKKIPNKDYNVLDTALRYLIQRLENDLRGRNGKFLMITDEGRVGKMRDTARKMRVINYVPSRFGTNAQLLPIKTMIEDPLPKDSRQSYFIQLADFVSFLVYNHKLLSLNAGTLHNRWPTQIDAAQLSAWLNVLKPCLNLRASARDEFGIVCYPK